MGTSEEKKNKSLANLVVLNRAAVELATKQEEDLIGDYDAAYEEWQSRNRPYYVKFKGKTFEVPRSQPFAYALFISRHTKKVYDPVQRRDVVKLVIPDDQAYEYIRLMLGDEFVEALSNSKVEMDFVMNHIAPDIHAKWQGSSGSAGGGQQEKNAQTPGS